MPETTEKPAATKAKQPPSAPPPDAPPAGPEPDPWANWRDGSIPEPGVYEGVPEEVYHGLPVSVLSNSQLGEGWQRGEYIPRRVLAYRDRPVRDASHFRLGRLLHMSLVEPERFRDSAWLPAPVNERTGKPYGADTKAFREAEEEARAEGKALLSPEDVDLLKQMHASIAQSKKAMAYLRAPGRSEATAITREEVDGVTIMGKARADRLTKNGVLFDLKTSRNPVWPPEVFERTIHQYGYHRQAAWYDIKFGSLGEQISDAVILAIETKPPYLCAVHRIADAALDQGRAEVRHALKAIVTAEQTGEWPGYPDQLFEVGLPSYAMTVDRDGNLPGSVEVEQYEDAGDDPETPF